MLRIVSFLFPVVPRRITEKLIAMGSEATTLKKLKGATLRSPLAETVETRAMGRGTTEPFRSL
ncbi:hypothetical protein D3C86_2240080 [compost metagenome]